MRCQYKNCGGLILKQEAFGPYPERLYCSSCGRAPKGDRDVPENLETKICVKCGVEKPVAEFGILRSAEDGLNPRCKKCKREGEQKSKTNKEIVPRPKLKTDKSKIPEPPPEKTISQGEANEVWFVKAFKKSIIKNFLESDLIPLLKEIAKKYE